MIILVVIMIVFGAGKLPEIGSAFGNSIRNFKKSMKDAEEETEKLTEATTDAVGTEPCVREHDDEATKADGEESQPADPPTPAPTESKDK